MASILIVDDSKTQAETLRMVLEDHGHQAATANDVPAALVALRQQPWDLIISDVVMPDQSGYDLCRQVKAESQVPVLLLTGLNDPGEILRALEAGADNFATKGADPLLLSDRVEELLSGRRVRSNGGSSMDVSFMGQTFHVTADRTQILRLLMATFEDMVRTNRRLEAHERELATTQDRLQHYATELEDKIQKGRRLEDELRHKNVELLEQNHKVLAATRMKSDFLAGMSHELRTPLNCIIGFTEALADGVVGEPPVAFREYLHDILQSARHLLRLINDVLDLAKVESGKMEIYPETVDVLAVLEETAEIVRTQTLRKKIQLTVHGHPEVAQVVVDPSRLKQILYNYLSNAIKFTPEGGRVTVRVAPVGSEAWRLQVEDTGIGIQPEDLSRLFVEFQQVGHPCREEGTGLGLALTRRLVELQGGQVEAASRPGYGSTFGLVLPRMVRRAVEVTSTELPPPPVHHIPQGRLDGVTVLVVDDSALSLKLMELLLRAQKCTVRTARTAVEALQQVESFQPRLVLMDVQLPDASGHELLPALRQAAVPPQAIVAVTAQAMKEDVREGLAAGFDGYLTKPIEPRLLPDQLLAILQGRSGISGKLETSSGKGDIPCDQD